MGIERLIAGLRSLGHKQHADLVADMQNRLTAAEAKLAATESQPPIGFFNSNRPGNIQWESGVFLTRAKDGDPIYWLAPSHSQQSAPPKLGFSKDWCENMAKLESEVDFDIVAGAPHLPVKCEIAHALLRKASEALEAVCEFPDSQQSAWEARRNAEDLVVEIVNHLRDRCPSHESEKP